jgi:hypothetical protein
MSTCFGRVCSVLVLALLGTGMPASAQERTYLGNVVTSEATRIQVRVVDESTKREELIWFAIGKDTRVKRGDANLSLVGAKIQNGERVAIVGSATAKGMAAEIRLAPSAPLKPSSPAPAAADPHAGHQMPGGQQMPMPPSGNWHVMQDGVVYGLFNRQGGPRGGRESVVPNWWMGMAMREAGRHQISLNGMFSLDAATVGKSGYRELFQVGEVLDGKPLIDHQHPHDLFMQLAAAWRIALPKDFAVTFSGGPAGEPTLGPIAFMHRPSASGLILAPLGHHTFDSTHISFGVVAAGIERGKWTIEGSVFNGREPDEHRWDFDFGRLDSYAARAWFRPTEEWGFQVSSGKLIEPEQLEEGNVIRTTASASWFRQGSQGLRAVTAGYGVNAAHGERRHGVFGEFTMERQPYSFSGRVDLQQVETSVLLTGEIPHDDDHEREPARRVAAVTFGGTRRLASWRGFEGDVGAHMTLYGVPDILKPTHGSRPVSFQLFFRLRLPTGGSERMWNMRMSGIHQMAMDHSAHGGR